MADIDLKTETPDTTLPTTGFLFGADSQAAASPSVFTVQSVATTLLGSTTLTGAAGLTADAPVLNMSQTWNSGAVTFTGLKFNATDTASAGGSLLMDLQVGGLSRVKIFKFGALQTFSASGGSAQFSIAVDGEANSRAFLGLNSSNDPSLSFGAGGASARDTFFTRRGAANLRFGAADAAAPVAQTLSVQSVVAGTTNIAGANLTITGSQGTGTGAGGSIIFQVAPAGSSGTAQNALATALTIASTTDVTFAANAVITGKFFLNADLTGNDYFFGSNFYARTTVRLASGTPLGWSSSATSPNAAADLILARDAANTLAQRNGTAAQALRVYNTYTDATTFERANIFWDSNVLKIGTEKGSVGGTARALELQTDGIKRLSIGATGTPYTAIFTNATYFGTDSTNGAGIVSNIGTGGILRLVNTNADNFDRLQFGGGTSSFPALKRSSASLIVRLADDTANAALESASLKTDAPTGGTAATWKLGTVASVTPTLQNRTIEVDIGGTIYYISAKTTND